MNNAPARNEQSEEYVLNQLHMQIKLTNPTYNKNISSRLDPEDYEDLFTLYTRDLRLGNLSTTEFNMARQYLSFAGDLLSLGEDYAPPALSSMRRVADFIELSHSKKGWARKLLGTFRREEFRRDELSEEKNSMFGRKKRSGD